MNQSILHSRLNTVADGFPTPVNPIFQNQLVSASIFECQENQ
jgi:hypothetical protein